MYDHPRLWIFSHYVFLIASLILPLITMPAWSVDVPLSRHVISGTYDAPNFVFSVDINGDGNRDVLSVSRNNTDLTWWNNTAGDGSAWSASPIATDFVGRVAHAADVDGDGDIDVLGAQANNDEITWWENVWGDGSVWSEHVVDNNFGGATTVFATDVDGDGDTDIIGAAGNDDEIAWWENNAGDGLTWIEHSVDGNFDNAYRVFPADIDGDGDVDILGSSNNPIFVPDAEIVWWENTAGDGSAWTKYLISGNHIEISWIFSIDVDGDGDLDVLAADFREHIIAWYENITGNGSHWAKHIIDGNYEFALTVHAVDLDHDGDVDVLSMASDNDEVTWWENTSGDESVWLEHTIETGFDGAYSVYADDVDCDGDIDILGAAIFDDEIVWWENDSIPSSSIHSSAVFFEPESEHIVDDNFYRASCVQAADLDRDGDLDVLGSSYDLNDITWWENTAGDSLSWSKRTIDGEFQGSRWAEAADIDGDGILDAVGAAVVDDAIRWWRNDGDPANDGWTEYPIDDNFDGANCVTTSDVDSDGDLDVLGAAYYGGDITWWENDGDPIDGGWAEHLINGDFGGAFALHTADLDKDGDPDVLAAANIDGEITWWENQPWGQVQKLIANEPTVNAEFPWSLKINNNNILIGSRYADLGGIANSGAAYLYNKDKGGVDNWGLCQRLEADIRANSDYFGTSVGFSGAYAIAGSRWR